MDTIQSHADRISSTKLSPPTERAGEHAKEIEDMTDAFERVPPADTENPNVREAFPEIDDETDEETVEEIDEEPDEEIDEEVVEVRETVFDLSRGEWGGFVDRPLAIELFRPLEEIKYSCAKICFGNRSYGVDAALVAKSVLMNVQKTLKDVELTNFVCRRSEDEALEVMKIFSSALEGCMLRSLSLELEELGEKGIEVFAPLLKSQKTLETLEFISSNISLEAAGAILKLLPSIEKIEKLEFIYNQKADDAVEALSELVKKCIALEDSENNECIALEDINFSNNYYGIFDAMDLVGSLWEGSRLTMHGLELNMCRVSLSQVISGHQRLTEVDLRYMNLQDERVIAIAHCLKNTAPSLRVLTVGRNNITPKAAPALAECLAVKNMLTMFLAGGNKLKDDGSVVICKAISEGHEQLQQLELSANAMTGIGAKAAAEAVANKPYFCCLDISRNFITKKGIATVKDVLRNGTKGESVLGHLYQYKDVGGMQYECREEGLTDSDTVGGEISETITEVSH